MEEKEQPKTKPEQAEALARGYFREGLNCAECVMQSYLDLHETNLPSEILTLAVGFGNGIGGTRNMCGAIAGAVMAVGLKKGRQDPFAKETPKERIMELREAYPTFAEMVKEIEARYGTLICSEMSAAHGDFDGKERKRNCQDIIGFCAALAAKYSEDGEVC